MQELIERDLGPFSGQLVKDKKEYFALAAGDHVEGMEPFADVQKRMEHAMELLAATGHQAVAAVSHGAAINVLLEMCIRDRGYHLRLSLQENKMELKEKV